MVFERLYLCNKCLLCITEIINFLCTFSTTLLEKDNVNVDIFCCVHIYIYTHTYTYVCVQVRERGRKR